MKSRRFIITEIRERQDNEFLFGCSERVVACSEFQRLLSFLREHGFKELHNLSGGILEWESKGFPVS